MTGQKHKKQPSATEVQNDTSVKHRLSTLFWGVALGAIGAAGSLLGVYQFGLSNAHSTLAPIAKQSYTQEFQSWFGDIDTEGKAYLGTEKNVVIEFSQPDSTGYQSAKIVGCEGEMRYAGSELLRRSWDYSGFKSGEYLTFAYASDGNNEYGAGVCVLMRHAKGYEGYWIGRDTRSKSIVWAPYILSTEKLSPEEAVDRFPSLGTRPYSGDFESWKRLVDPIPIPTDTLVRSAPSFVATDSKNGP